MGTRKEFAVHIHHHSLCDPRSALVRELRKEVRQLQSHDRLGQRWSTQNYPFGYTSFHSLSNLHQRTSTFIDLEKRIRRSVLRFVTSCRYQVEPNSIFMSDCWANIMGKGCAHSGHIHPLSLISGTFYLDIPRGAPGIRFEDPCLPFQMACPPKMSSHGRYLQSVEIQPRPGDLVLFESFLRHEVPVNTVSKERVSISFNYNWDPSAWAQDAG